MNARLHDYLELTKIRLVSLTLWSTAAGYLLASHGALAYGTLFKTILGSCLVAAGSMALNEWMEQKEDARMSRTADRPVPAGRISSKQALILGIILALLGLGILYDRVHPLSAVLAAATLISYLFIYTPLKKVTPYCTILGAIPGAIPPLIGWSAVDGSLNFQAWILFAIIFFWQMPHFYAISWFYRKDYSEAGFKMLSVQDPEGKKIAAHIFWYTLLQVPVSILPSLVHLTGAVYFLVSLMLGVGLIFLSFLCLKNLDRYARLFFRGSLLYLTLLFIFMVADKIR